MTWHHTALAVLLLAGCGGGSERDLGPEERDLGMAPDLGLDPDQGGPIDVSAQIEAVRAATPGPLDPTLPVGDASDGPVITYVRTGVGDDPDGFFVQASQGGPALFVALPAGAVTPPAEVGQQVRFDVIETGIVDGQHRVTAVSGYTQLLPLVAIAPLVQDISAIDVPAQLDDLESELVTLSGETVGNPEPCGDPHACYRLSTEGVVSATELLRLRGPNPVLGEARISSACQVDIGPIPLWRDGPEAQALILRDNEVVVRCNGLALIDVMVTGPSALVLIFNRGINPGSIVDRTTQFSLQREGAEQVEILAYLVEDNEIILTTRPMLSGERYRVRAAADGTPAPIRDIRGMPLLDTASLQTFTAP